MNAIFQSKENLEMIVRGAQFLCGVIIFATSTSITGIGSGDFAFLISYNIVLYAILYTVFVLKTRQIDMKLTIKASIDAILTLLLFIAAIWLVSSRTFTYCQFTSCAAAYACAVFLFAGTFIQGSSVYLTYIEMTREEDDHEAVF
ncbi:hypothetical protein THRCLA_21987 [Thraustotheca clavata]|uniref:MARVEL domain-containing protein n=1 Tax=Thraustotheca clavata TaxID=74557 RepID=A0A1V9ZFC2_9STRA|nr:hypothetical protein THRCLA_21987 [Thraustotheca clavata]